MKNHLIMNLTNNQTVESIISTFETELRNLGFSDDNGALLIQLNISGKNYIKYSGNLNNLNASQATHLSSESNSHMSFLEFLKKEIDTSNLASSTKTLHKNTLKLLQEYCPSIRICDLTTTFLYDLESYMKEKKLAINTIGRHMKVLKKYTNIAIKKELLIKYPFKGYSIKSEQTKLQFLTEKELESFEKYDLLSSEEEEVMRGFLFSCYTGLRYSDVVRFTKQDLYSINRKKWIVMNMKKTGKEIRIPISTAFEGKGLRICKEIRRSRGTLFRLGNNQKTNRILKRIIQRIGLKKKITFHSARHTCATLLLYKGVSITTVQKLLGHKSVKTTQIYAEITDQTIEKDLKKSNRRK